jgi:hypothetical protein
MRATRRESVLILFGVLSTTSEAKGLDPNIYPQEDFYNRKLRLPVDHQNPEEGRFALYCHSLPPLPQSSVAQGLCGEQLKNRERVLIACSKSSWHTGPSVIVSG